MANVGDTVKFNVSGVFYGVAKLTGVLEVYDSTSDRYNIYSAELIGSGAGDESMWTGGLLGAEIIS
ncbi:hypothetical protein EOM39_03285 [Candidatus Gracilibacteria bacterium]|nr:hypothetical protein [Candidatus Gracilibacteria bacterium]